MHQAVAVSVVLLRIILTPIYLPNPLLLKIVKCTLLYLEIFQIVQSLYSMGILEFLLSIDLLLKLFLCHYCVIGYCLNAGLEPRIFRVITLLFIELWLGIYFRCAVFEHHVFVFVHDQ